MYFKPQTSLGGRFESAPYRLGDLGLPLLENALGGIECSLVGEVNHGDHTVFVGEVKTANVNKDGEPLILSSTGWTYGG